MIITLKVLKEKGACPEAIRLFRAAVGTQTADFEWTAAAQGWVLASPIWRRWLGWCWNFQILPMWSMSRVFLSGADLREADLSGVDLREANLSGADLRGTYLNGAYLIGADLREADLCGADLSGADLCGADLNGAYLCGADLSGVYLSGADLIRADLRGANLNEVVFDSVTKWPAGFTPPPYPHTHTDMSTSVRRLITMKWKKALLTWYRQYRYQKTMRQIRNLWASFDCDLSHLTNFEIELGIFTAAGIIVINRNITADEFTTVLQEFKEHP